MTVYRFVRVAKVYNPFSRCWVRSVPPRSAATGLPLARPPYLVQLLRPPIYDLNGLALGIYIPAGDETCDSFDGNNNLVGAFYPSGYLTIKF